MSLSCIKHRRQRVIGVCWNTEHPSLVNGPTVSSDTAQCIVCSVYKSCLHSQHLHINSIETLVLVAFFVGAVFIVAGSTADAAATDVLTLS